MIQIEQSTFDKSRTPPGVRELKRHLTMGIEGVRRRTPPGVRELKLRLVQ